MVQPVVMLRFHVRCESDFQQGLDRLRNGNWESIVSPHPGPVLEVSSRKRVPCGTPADVAIADAKVVLCGLEAATDARILSWSVRFTAGGDGKACFGEGTPLSPEYLVNAEARSDEARSTD
jgi:hypothetical protein